MSQHSFAIANEAGAAFRADVNNALQALASCSRGAAAPGTTYAGQVWDDSTANVQKKRNAANAAWIVKMTLDETFVIARSSNTILGLSDIGKTFVATSTFTQTFTAAATLGDDWWVLYRNDGTGVITFDPNAAETIDGAATLELYPGESCIIKCNNAAFKTIGRHFSNFKVGSFTRDISLATGTQAVTGVGFKPKVVIFFAAFASDVVASSGFDDGSTRKAMWQNNPAGVDILNVSSDAILITKVAGTSYAGAINSFDTDGFTISWTKTGLPTGTATINYLALR